MFRSALPLVKLVPNTTEQLALQIRMQSSTFISTPLPLTLLPKLGDTFCELVYRILRSNKLYCTIPIQRSMLKDLSRLGHVWQIRGQYVYKCQLIFFSDYSKVNTGLRVRKAQVFCFY